MKRVAGIALITLAGAASAALMVAQPAAAWDINNLPNGYAVISDSGHADCAPARWYTLNGTTIGCTSDPSFQANLDAFVDSTICTVNPSADPTKCAPTTTTDAATTTAAATTTTAAPVTPPVTTTVTQIVTQPASGTTPATTTTVIVVTTATPVETNLQAQIDALATQLKALTDRVTRLEKAGDASWLAFEQAVAGGATVADAADQARGTWLNVVNQLGAFAPVA